MYVRLESKPGVTVGKGKEMVPVDMLRTTGCNDGGILSIVTNRYIDFLSLIFFYQSMWPYM